MAELDNKERYTLNADVDKNLKDRVVKFAQKETEGNVSSAVRKILRDYLSKYEKQAAKNK